MQACQPSAPTALMSCCQSPTKEEETLPGANIRESLLIEAGLLTFY